MRIPRQQDVDLSLSPFPGEGNEKNDTAQKEKNTADQSPGTPSSYTINNEKDATRQEKHPAKDLKLAFSSLLSYRH